MLYSNLISDKELLDFSQHFGVARPAFMGTRLFPDRKTEYIEQEYYRLVRNGNLPMSAMVHALDTEAHIASRVPLERVTTEELLIKEKINVSEELRKTLRGLTMRNDALVRYIFDDVARMAEMVVTRVERAKMDAITKGKYTITENGLSLEIDYGVPEENFVSSDWTDANADILGDIRTWRKIAVDNGSTPNVAITTEEVVNTIMHDPSVQKAIFGTTGTGILPTIDQLNALMRSQFGITIETNEARYGVRAEANSVVSINAERFFPEGGFVLASTDGAGAIGTGLWGVTPEEEEQGGAFDTLRQQQFVTVVTYDTPDPVATWTKASGVFVPVMPNPYGHIIASVGVESSGSEG